MTRRALVLSRRLHTQRSERADRKYHAAKKGSASAKHWLGRRKLEDALVAKRTKQIHALAPEAAVGWMPAAEKRARASAGGWAINCKPKGILHTTEGLGDATSTLDANRDHPHFEVLRDGHKIQYISVFEASKALRNAPGGVETNRAHCIQIEVVGQAAKPGWPAAQKKAVAEVMRFIEQNAGIEQVSHVKFVNGGSQRLGLLTFIRTGGWMGHQHVPENDHVDPGAIDIKELLK